MYRVGAEQDIISPRGSKLCVVFLRGKYPRVPNRRNVWSDCANLLEQYAYAERRGNAPIAQEAGLNDCFHPQIVGRPRATGGKVQQSVRNKVF